MTEVDWPVLPDGATYKLVEEINITINPDGSWDIQGTLLDSQEKTL